MKLIFIAIVLLGAAYAIYNLIRSSTAEDRAGATIGYRIFVVSIVSVVAMLAFGQAAAQTYPTDTIVTPENAQDLRTLLTHDVFGDCGFPTGAAMAAGTGTWNSYPYQGLSSGAKLFKTGAHRLLIFHGGHNQDPLANDSGGPLVQYALPLGWDVLTLGMPGGDHSRFASEAHPLTNFMTPLALSVNYAIQHNSYDAIVMAGLSGGGWTTVLYSALDTRISKSVPVAGSWPEYLRYASTNPNTIGDYEQQLPGLELSYLDLYTLATAGQRTQLQVFNSNDPCCFAGSAPLDYLDKVQTAATALGGQFNTLIVSNSQHSVHASVFDDIAGLPPPFVPTVAEWRLDETAGTAVAEAGGRFPGTYHNGPTLAVPGLTSSGTAVAFDGNSDYVTVPDHAALRPGTGEYAIVFRAAFDSTNYGMAFGKFDPAFPYPGPTIFFNMYNETPTLGRIQLRDTRVASYWVNSASTGLNNGVPHCYVAQRVCEGSTCKLQLYIDRTLDAEITLPSVTNHSYPGPIYLFSRPDAGQYVRGTFDNAQYHVGKALTQAEIDVVCRP